MKTLVTAGFILALCVTSVAWYSKTDPVLTGLIIIVGLLGLAGVIPTRRTK
jgi:hypothetical protein